MATSDETRLSPIEGACIICGHSEYTWGKLVADSRLEFAPPDAFWVFGRRPMMARECNQCGNIQLFDEEKLGSVPQYKEKRKRQEE